MAIINSEIGKMDLVLNTKTRGILKFVCWQGVSTGIFLKKWLKPNSTPFQRGKGSHRTGNISTVKYVPRPTNQMLGACSQGHLEQKMLTLLSSYALVKQALL